MRKFLIILAAALVTLAVPAFANTTLFLSPDPVTYKINVILPNGEREAWSVGPAISALGNQHTTYDYRLKSAEVEVTDDLGNVLWKEPFTIGNNYMIVTKAGKTEVAPTGFYSGDNSVQAAVVANLTGETGSFDFIGRSGSDAQRGITLPITLDSTKPLRFAPGEENYKVRFTDSSGQTHEVVNEISGGGRNWVIFKGSNGKYTAAATGYIKK